MEWAIIVVLLVAGGSLNSSDAQTSRSRSQSPTRPPPDLKIPAANLHTDKQPFYLTQDNTFWPFNAIGELVFYNKDRIKLYCETGFLYPNLADTTLKLTYDEGKFKQGSTVYEFKDIICKKNPTVVSKELRVSGQCNGGTLYDIGYNVIDWLFVPIYQICFDRKAQIAYYSSHTILPGSISRKKITGAKFTDVSSIGVFEESYAKMDTRFSAGHLAPVGDFFYAVQQQATFVYPNVAPQWTKFNSDQWSELERQIRSNQNGKTFKCFTGVLGVMKSGNEPWYLNKDKKEIPVPELFFRVVYEPLSQQAVVFIGVNDRISNARPKPICTNVRDDLQGFRVKGLKEYLYACQYADFRSKANALYLPELTVSGLLFAK